MHVYIHGYVCICMHIRIRKQVFFFRFNEFVMSTKMPAILLRVSSTWSDCAFAILWELIGVNPWMLAWYICMYVCVYIYINIYIYICSYALTNAQICGIYLNVPHDSVIILWYIFYLIMNTHRRDSIMMWWRICVVMCVCEHARACRHTCMYMSPTYLYMLYLGSQISITYMDVDYS